jgi:hypothetical protein
MLLHQATCYYSGVINVDIPSSGICYNWATASYKAVGATAARGDNGYNWDVQFIYINNQWQASFPLASDSGSLDSVPTPAQVGIVDSSTSNGLEIFANLTGGTVITADSTYYTQGELLLVLYCYVVFVISAICLTYSSSISF